MELAPWNITILKIYSCNVCTPLRKKKTSGSDFSDALTLIMRKETNEGWQSTHIFVGFSRKLTVSFDFEIRLLIIFLSEKNIWNYLEKVFPSTPTLLSPALKILILFVTLRKIKGVQMDKIIRQQLSSCQSVISSLEMIKLTFICNTGTVTCTHLKKLIKCRSTTFESKQNQKFIRVNFTMLKVHTNRVPSGYERNT